MGLCRSWDGPRFCCAQDRRPQRILNRTLCTFERNTAAVGARSKQGVQHRSMTDIRARAEQLGSNAGVRTGGSAMYFKSKDSLLG